MRLHWVILVHIKVTQTLHAQLSLNRYHWCKAHVNQRPFSFCHFIVKSLRHFHHAILLSEFSSVELPQSMKSLVTVTFLLFGVSSCPKATGVPSPTISMVQRTALRLRVNFLLNKSPYSIRGSDRILGCFSFGLDRSLRDQARWHFT